MGLKNKITAGIFLSCIMGVLAIGTAFAQDLIIYPKGGRIRNRWKKTSMPATPGPKTRPDLIHGICTGGFSAIPTAASSGRCGKRCSQGGHWLG